MNRIPRIFTHSLPLALTSCELTGETAHYLLKVLRVKAGQSIELFDGQGQSVRAEVKTLERRALTIQCQAHQAEDNRSPVETTLALALIKSERFEWALQKATELGVDRIVPIISQRTDGRLAEKLEKKYDRWESIITSACEQSLRSHRPHLDSACRLDQLEIQGQGMFLDPTATQGFQPGPSKQTLLIGPEGGWSEDEIRWARDQGCQGVSLGPRILRAETAAITALSLCQYLSGDLAG